MVCFCTIGDKEGPLGADDWRGGKTAMATPEQCLFDECPLLDFLLILGALRFLLFFGGGLDPFI